MKYSLEINESLIEKCHLAIEKIGSIWRILIPNLFESNKNPNMFLYSKNCLT